MTPVQELRLSYRLGAAVDAAAVVQLLSPRVLELTLGPSALVAAPAFRVATGTAAALMLGWTALLLWADRAPLERRGVLPLTALVVAALGVNELAAALAGTLPVGRVAPLLGLQAALAALFLRSWRRAEADASRSPSPAAG